MVCFGWPRLTWPSVVSTAEIHNIEYTRVRQAKRQADGETASVNNNPPSLTPLPFPHPLLLLLLPPVSLFYSPISGLHISIESYNDI